MGDWYHSISVLSSFTDCFSSVGNVPEWRSSLITVHTDADNIYFDILIYQLGMGSCYSTHMAGKN